MEDKNVDMSVSGGTPASSRWNPTKEQINMLESLFEQGIRTPSADQIQQITSRLKEYGRIEMKNVFYWFQNNKARQKQKQKQESMVYINRYHRKTAPVFAPPPSNVVCSPSDLPQRGVGFYSHYPNVLLPSGIKRRERKYKMGKAKRRGGCGAGYEPTHLIYNIIHTGPINEEGIKNMSTSDETLTLFPLHPTGILEGRNSAETTGIEKGSWDQTFFDFFGENGTCESES